jgi:hypothetical protein
VFTDMLHTFARVSATAGAVKPRLLADAGRLVRETDAVWRVEHERATASPHIGPFEGTALMSIYLLWTDLCERSAMFCFDFDAVREELHRWAADPATFSKIALRMIVLGRD